MTPTVSFVTPTLLDLRLLTTFGVSIKETENPIGYFGTGMKYAIAILLRHNHKVTLHSGRDRYTFEVREEQIRGQSIPLVHLCTPNTSSRLSFSTDLGRDWQLWQALRELESNTRDEGGHSVGHRVPHSDDTTTIIIEGEGFYLEYLNLDSIFLSSLPIAQVGPLSIHPGPSDYLYYRRVRASKLGIPSLYTYSLTNAPLAEDRSITDPSSVFRHAIPLYVQQLDKKDIITPIITASKEVAEAEFSFSTFSGCEPSPAFIAAVGAHRFAPTINHSARTLWRAATASGEVDWDEVTPSPSQHAMIHKALALLASIDFHVDQPIRLSTELDALGMAMRSPPTIWLNTEVFHGGLNRVAGTILEEHIHLVRHLHDRSRGMQNFLLDLTMALAERLQGENG